MKTPVRIESYPGFFLVTTFLNYFEEKEEFILFLLPKSHSQAGSARRDQFRHFILT